MGEVTFKQGNIFSYVKKYDLSIVAGHIGLNGMNIYWRNFKNEYQKFKSISNPFDKIGNEFIQLPSSNKYIYFMPPEENQGISDDSLVKNLSDIFSEAINKKIKSVIFNGLDDVDHGTNTSSNRKSNEKRVSLIFNFIDDFLKSNKESFDEVCLITLRDDFIRLDPNFKV